MRHLDDSVLDFIKSLMPPKSFIVLIIATKEGVSVDTNISDPAKAKAFVLETAEGMSDPSRN